MGVWLYEIFYTVNVEQPRHVHDKVKKGKAAFEKLTKLSPHSSVIRAE